MGIAKAYRFCSILEEILSFDIFVLIVEALCLYGSIRSKIQARLEDSRFNSRLPLEVHPRFVCGDKYTWN